MAFPIRHLPMVQQWDCHSCGDCCSDLWVQVSEEERRRIEAQGWAERPEFQGVRLFVRTGWFSRNYRLNQRGDACVFLSSQGRCRIHEEFGAEAKPLACRLYPFVLVPAGDHWRVSVRFACPSAARNQGRPINTRVEEIRPVARVYEQTELHGGRRFDRIDELPPPRLQGRQSVSWKDLELFTQTLVGLLTDRREPFARRMLKCLALVRICKAATFESVTGSRLREFLELAKAAVNAEVPREIDRIDRPGWIGRILFRSTLAIYLRKDQGRNRGVSARGRLALIGPAWRLVRGKGPIPRLQVGLPAKTFQELEGPVGPLPASSEDALERYYRVKVEAMQFCGIPYYGVPLWEGFHSLALTLPIILWLARGYRDLGHPRAVTRALQIADEHHGFNPFLGKLRQRLGVRILAYRRDLDRLIAWYSR